MKYTKSFCSRFLRSDNFTPGCHPYFFFMCCFLHRNLWWLIFICSTRMKVDFKSRSWSWTFMTIIVTPRRCFFFLLRSRWASVNITWDRVSVGSRSRFWSRSLKSVYFTPGYHPYFFFMYNVFSIAIFDVLVFGFYCLNQNDGWLEVQELKLDSYDYQLHSQVLFLIPFEESLRFDSYYLGKSCDWFQIEDLKQIS